MSGIDEWRNPPGAIGFFFMACGLGVLLGALYSVALVIIDGPPYDIAGGVLLGGVFGGLYGAVAATVAWPVAYGLIRSRLVKKKGLALGLGVTTVAVATAGMSGLADEALTLVIIPGAIASIAALLIGTRYDARSRPDDGS